MNISCCVPDISSICCEGLVLAWSEETGVSGHYNAPGKSKQNGIGEAFNSKMRTIC